MTNMADLPEMDVWPIRFINYSTADLNYREGWLLAFPLPHTEQSKDIAFKFDDHEMEISGLNDLARGH